MNERIKKLAEQAGMESWGIGNGDNVTEIVEKFAELIIKDCAKVAWRHTPDYEALDYGHLISDKIKEYFGVK